ncbi:MAG TPA: ABC transporter permease [Beijerinckiaceae bacterium]|jgi:NitT/TauT family transport system permease protein
MNRAKLLALQIGVGLVLLGLWHVITTYPISFRGTLIFGKTENIQFFFSTPLKVLARVAKEFADVKPLACLLSVDPRSLPFIAKDPCGILYHLAITLIETILAFAAGAVGGILFGFVFARGETLAAVFDPYIKAANALPRVVLAPIFALWFGLGIWSKVALGFTLVFFIVFFNVYQGVREVPQVVLANARMLGMNQRQLLRHVYWPAALTWVFSSLHTSVGFALVGAVVGEYLGASAGLGYKIQEAESVFDVTGVFAGMLILAVFVILIDALVTAIENRLLVWRPGPATGAQS